jgi:hypothetical protein
VESPAQDPVNLVPEKETRRRGVNVGQFRGRYGQLLSRVVGDPGCLRRVRASRRDGRKVKEK